MTGFYFTSVESSVFFSFTDFVDNKCVSSTYAEIKEFLPKQHRIISTKKADYGTNITRKLLKLGYKNIIGVGGDGTINEVANGFFVIKRRTDQHDNEK